ncbi:MAG: biotin attachment protein [Desulfobacter sp.]|nr:MAG: biotin attachment protein [Desulfobacter sp.]
MEYHLDVNNKIIDLDLQSRSENTALIRIGQEDYDLEFQRISDRKIHFSVNGSQFNAWVENTDQGKSVMFKGRHYFIIDKDSQDQARSKKLTTGQEPTTVTPPMPAIVIQVPVSPGDLVKKGDIVVVVSAMKMETALKAPYSGKISRISVAEGDKVMPGDILADIDKITDEETA